MSLFLLDDTLSVDVYFDRSDNQFSDNVCIRLWESCPEDEKIFIADETNLFLTPDQALQLAQMLLAAVDDSIHQ
ncbi:MAG TPA: hypothetical protein VIH16_07520 [Bellilinea sp.]